MQSEQNPTYWLQLLLATKQSGAKVTWYDPFENRTCERNLTTRDWRNWSRFVMSFLINGVGYHILVHALPIQVASQSSLTGVVFRAVGMMYLVDLDDTPGYTLTIVTQPNTEVGKKPDPSEDESNTKAADVEDMGEDSRANGMDTAALSAEAAQIIEEARAKLDALARGQKTYIGGAMLLDTTPPPVTLQEENKPAPSRDRGLPVGEDRSVPASNTTVSNGGD